MTANRPPLHFLSRATRITEPSMSLEISLLPREAFGDDAETLDLYDTFDRLRSTMNEHERDAGREKIAAQTATEIYQRKVRDALAAGQDATKIKNDTDKHTAQSAAHIELARTARYELTHVARALAHRIAEVADQHLTPAEVRLTAETEKMRTAIKQLTAAWGRYSAAWQERRVLGNAALFGGRMDNYDADGHFPAAVRDAIALLEDHLSDLDRLKRDEALIQSERDPREHTIETPTTEPATLITAD